MQNLEPKMTRTTRVLYVEEMEVSDTDNENTSTSKSFKSFEMKTKVQSKTGESGAADVESAADSITVSNSSLKHAPTPAWGGQGRPTEKTKKPSATEGRETSAQTSESLSESGQEETAPRKMPKTFGERSTVRPQLTRKGTTLHSGLRTHKSVQDSEELKTIDDSLLYSTLQPLFVCMKASGIFFIRRQRTAERKEAIKNCTPLQAYCLFIILLLLVNMFRSLLAFDDFSFDSEFLFKGLAAIFYYESMSRAALAYWQCWKKKQGIQQFFLGLEATCYPDGIIPYETSLTGSMYFFIILTFLIGFANVGATAYGLFGPPNIQELFNVYLVPMSSSMKGIEAAKGVILLLTFINTQVAILSLSFYSIVCFLLYKEFEYLRRTFSMKIGPDGNFTDDLEKFRLRHQRRCKLVESADSLFKYYIGNTYLTNIPLLCLLLYSMVNAENDVAYRFISGFRLAYVLIQMVVLSVAATMINDQAHAPLADIYSIRVHATTAERQLEVNMFLNKLTGTSIGLTAWDMFVINKPTLLTVIGMILTYFFLLVQFRNPLMASSVCSCTFKSPDGANVSLPTMPEGFTPGSPF